MTGLSDKQRKQVDAIASLVTQPDLASITQGVELATALGDQEVFGELLSGLRSNNPTTSRITLRRRFPTPHRATMFDRSGEMQAWLDLAMVHLLAASDLPVRTEVTSVALGTAIRNHANPPPRMWVAGLERLTALTHLDLHLTSGDDDLDLSVLGQLPNLTHLRVRGRPLPGPIPPMAKLETLNGEKFQLEPGTPFPALQFIRGEFVRCGSITPETMPNLTEVEARGSITFDGYETLDRVSCIGGDVSVLGCRNIGHLSLHVNSFEAPDLRHVGLLDRASPGLNVSQLESLDQLQLSRKSKFTGGTFPAGTQLIDSQIILWGSVVTTLGNIGELPGLEVLLIPHVAAPVSLDTLRHATDLRVLDIRYSPGVTDLSPLRQLPKLEVLVLDDPDRFDIPEELVGKVQRFWRRYQLDEETKKDLRAKF